MPSTLQHYEFGILLVREFDLVNLLQEIWEALSDADQQSRMRIPMMSISHSDLMPISSERSDA